jgi:hypothetical protein
MSYELEFRKELLDEHGEPNGNIDVDASAAQIAQTDSHTTIRIDGPPHGPGYRWMVRAKTSAASSADALRTTPWAPVPHAGQSLSVQDNAEGFRLVIADETPVMQATMQALHSRLQSTPRPEEMN